jgi:uncharacterized sporulation protein YeaH/YhbH (DUF444 family)
MRKFARNGQLFPMRAKNGRMHVPITRLDNPRIVHGSSGSSIGRGPGKEDDVVGQDPESGSGGGSEGSGDGITISVDLEEFWKILQEELQLPDIKPKPNPTFEEIKIKYNDISKTGPESLRHTRRTMLEAVKRLAMAGELDNLHYFPDIKEPIRLITPINSDKRYRQYKEIKIPASNAIIFFARDCSGSMDAYKREVINDMVYWIDSWIRRFYKKVERCFVIHDEEAEEVSEKKFYGYGDGGGTRCSSAFKYIASTLKNKYPPHSYNIYIFYFTDGDNFEGDNSELINTMKNELGPDVANMIGITQICPYNYRDSVKDVLDYAIKKGVFSSDFLRLAGIGNENGIGLPTKEERNEQMLKAIKVLLGKDRIYSEEVS